MKAVVQRVSSARVLVDGRVTGQIGTGLLVLLGVAKDDTEQDLAYLVDKVVHLRIFEDDQQKMNRSALDVRGRLLVVSQFTLLADTRGGRRPSFFDAMPPEPAAAMVHDFAARAASHGLDVEQGVFGAMMDVELTNAGPVTIILDSADGRKKQ